MIPKEMLEQLKQDSKLQNKLKRNDTMIIEDAQDSFHSIWNNLVKEDPDKEENGWRAWCGYDND